MPVPAAFTATVTLSPEDVMHQVIAAVEGGGSSYWLEGFNLHEAEAYDPASGMIWYGQPKLYEKPFRIKATLSEPYKRRKTYWLTRDDILAQLDAFAQQYPSHLAEIVKREGDAGTADVFLQFCLFGEVVFG